MINLQWAAELPLDLNPEALDSAIERFAGAEFEGIAIPIRYLQAPGGPGLVRDLCYRHQIAPAVAFISSSELAKSADPVNAFDSAFDACDTLGVETLQMDFVDGFAGSAALCHRAADRCADTGVHLSLDLLPWADGDVSGTTEWVRASPAAVGVMIEVAACSTGTNRRLADGWADRINSLRIVHGDTGDQASPELEALLVVLARQNLTGWAALAGLHDVSTESLQAVLKRWSGRFNV